MQVEGSKFGGFVVNLVERMVAQHLEISHRAERRRRRRATAETSGVGWRRASWSLLAVATLGAALALGALHATTLIVVACLIFLAAGIVLYRRPLLSLPAPAWAFCAVAGYTAVQALPLPPVLVRLLSPAAAEVWQRAFEVAGSVGWPSLSLDRGATLLEALKWATYGAAFVVAASYGAARGMARGVLLPLGATVAVATVTLAHGLVGASAIYGIYEPTVPRSIWHTGPLLNPNHLASYLNFGIFCGLGLLVLRKPILPAWVIGLALAALIPSAIVSGSRGGVVGLAAGTAVFLLKLPSARAADADLGPLPRGSIVASMSAVAVIAIGFTAALASEHTLRQLHELNIEKLRMFSWARELVSDYPWFGVGRGAFESAFAAYRAGPSNEIYSHPENLAVQWVGEWGIPFGLLAAAAFGWLFRPRRLGIRWSAVATGTFAGLVAILVQNVVDFGLEVPGIALTVVVAMGVCWGHAMARRRGSLDARRDERFPVATLAVAAVAVSLGVGVALQGVKPLIYERRSLADAYRSLPGQDSSALGVLRGALSEAVLRHPAEPYFYRLGALLAWRSDEDPMPWLQRALDRGPSIGRTHFLVARVLAAKGAIKQALLQLRLATTFDPALVHSAVDAATEWSMRFDDLMRAVPHGEPGIHMLTILGRLSKLDEVTRERALLELVSRDPRRRASLTALASHYVQQVENANGDPAPLKNHVARTAAERWLKALEREAPTEGETILLHARLLQSSGATREAATFLLERCGVTTGPARTKCLQKRLDLSCAFAAGTDCVQASKDYIADGCMDSDQCAGVLERSADLMGSRGEWQVALGYYERAARERSEDRLWMKVARAGARVGALSRAANALSRVRSRSHFEPEYSRLTAAVRGGDPPSPGR
jgi:O-Antigen ligase